MILSGNSSWNIVNFRAGLVEAVRSLGFEPVVIAPIDPAGESRMALLGVRRFTVDMDRSGLNPFKDFKLFLQYRKLIREIAPAAYLGYTIKPNIYGSLAARLCGVPALPNISGLRVLNCTFGARLPAWAHRALRRATGFGIYDPLGLRLLRQPYRSSVAAQVAHDLGDSRPPADPFRFRADMLTDQDPSNSVGRVIWGVDGRDPTADRDLIDFCFSVPAPLLLGGSNARPLFELAFKDRLDVRQLRPATRGYQGADWYLFFTRDAVAERLHECRNHHLVEELLDLDYADKMLAAWPARWCAESMYHYRNDLLGAVATADYIKTNF